LQGLKNEHQREYDIIHKELDPQRYKQQVEEEKQRELESEKYGRKMREEAQVLKERQRRDWLEAGGIEE